MAQSKTILWQILKGVQSLTLGSSSVGVTVGGSATVSASWLGDGTISAVSNDTSKVTVSVSGSTVTVMGVAYGGASVTVTVSEGTLYEGATARLDVTVSASATLTVPTQSGTLVYSGAVLSPTWAGYDSSKMTIGGVTNGTNSGAYIASFTPKSGYAWTDGTTGTKNASWVIQKANAQATVSPSTFSLTVGDTVSLSVSSLGNGAVTAVSSNTSVATVSVSGSTVTVSGVMSGSVTVTVSVGETANYLSGSTSASGTVSATRITTVTIKNGNSASVPYEPIPIIAYASTGPDQRVEQISGADRPGSQFTIPIMIGGTLVLRVPGGSTSKNRYSFDTRLCVLNDYPIQSAREYINEYGDPVGLAEVAAVFYIKGDSPVISVFP